MGLGKVLLGVAAGLGVVAAAPVLGGVGVLTGIGALVGGGVGALGGSIASHNENKYHNSDYSNYNNASQNFATDNGDFMDELSDSLALTKTILPDLLPLLNLDDYKNDMMTLLAKLVDSNLVKPTDYEMYFSKFYLEAKIWAFNDSAFVFEISV